MKKLSEIKSLRPLNSRDYIYLHIKVYDPEVEDEYTVTVARKSRGDKVKMTWIPVSERLPTEKPGRVLIWDGDMYIGRYSEFSGTWYKGDMCSVGGNQVTHWMLLPEPPKE